MLMGFLFFPSRMAGFLFDNMHLLSVLDGRGCEARSAFAWKSVHVSQVPCIVGHALTFVVDVGFEFVSIAIDVRNAEEVVRREASFLLLGFWSAEN